MSSHAGAPSAPGDSGGGGALEPEYGPIKAVPVRHPGRWVAVAVLVVLTAKLIDTLITNKAFDWSFIGQAMVQSPVIKGLIQATILGTIGAMFLGIVLGVILAVMRLSDNPVLRACAWAYVWFFRGVPRYVLLALMASLGTLWPIAFGGLTIGVPFGHDIMHALGLHGDLALFHLDPNKFVSGELAIWGGIIGLGLSEAAYMAEIARAGILSVDPGQQEAASALGMSRPKAMRRIVLPQAMRVIVPPTGNEMIGMFKDTTLMAAIPVNIELFFQLNAIGARTFQVFATNIAAIIWYLIIGSVMMYLQMHVERYFGRGFGAKKPPKDRSLKTRLIAVTGGAR